MDPGEARKAIEALLEITELLSSGTEISEEDLKSIDGICSEIKASLAPEESPGVPKGFPRTQWVFDVERTQYARFAVEAKDFHVATARAGAYLHENLEALRFSWDRTDPLTLSVLKLHREPEGTP